MKRIKSDYIFYIINVLLLLTLAAAARGQTNENSSLEIAASGGSFTPGKAVIGGAVQNGKSVTVKIYLRDAFESENLLESLEMVAVEREVNAASPLRFALEAQLAGATDEEENTLRLFSPVSGINLMSVRVKNKTAYAKFTRTETEAFSKIDALRFRKAIRLTALQFPSVKKVEICLDGAADFWRVNAKTHRKCA